MDLAEGHFKSVDTLLKDEKSFTLNLGTGLGVTVLELVEAYELTCGHKISYEIIERRDGDIAVCYADPSQAFETIGWASKRNIHEMCRDSWNWQCKHPNGF